MISNGKFPHHSVSDHMNNKKFLYGHYRVRSLVKLSNPQLFSLIEQRKRQITVAKLAGESHAKYTLLLKFEKYEWLHRIKLGKLNEKV